FFSSRRRHTRSKRDWSSDVCSSDLFGLKIRLHPESSFLVTAANKQRAGVKHDAPGVYSYRGKAFETHTVPSDHERTEENRRSVITLRSEEHTSELQSRFDLVCRLLLEKK